MLNHQTTQRMMLLDDWMNEFQPIANPNDEGEWMCQTVNGLTAGLFNLNHPRDRTFVALWEQDHPDCVWTVTAEGYDESISNGRCQVNYGNTLLTRIPCPFDSMITVETMDDDDRFMMALNDGNVEKITEYLNSGKALPFGQMDPDHVLAIARETDGDQPMQQEAADLLHRLIAAGSLAANSPYGHDRFLVDVLTEEGYEWAANALDGSVSSRQTAPG
ncbi:MAG: hypothetical protein Q7K26_01405 [bacterium]|nr:hypothetical protein [bacterium]